MKQRILPTTPDYLPPQELARCMRAMAALDIVMTPKERNWLRLVSVRPDGQGYLIDNGSGDTLETLFWEQNILLKGFAHENRLNQHAADEWDADFFKAVYAGVPQALLDLFEDEESLDFTTFCMWYDGESGCWRQNAVEGNDGGSRYLLGYVRRDAARWAAWASAYYGAEIPPGPAEKAYRGEALTAEDIRALCPDRDPTAALAELSSLNLR